MFGIPEAILVDNGPEFHGTALERGCREYGITLLHRPVARPHFGGHIEPYTRFYIQYAILELQKATHNALAGLRPRRRQWGALNAKAFLHVLRDVTTWSLTHFEAVRSWSPAEELTPIEISETHQLLSRHLRMTAADYAGDRSVRSLVDIENPGLRSSALWFAHSVMASFHQDASDRPTGCRRTVRQDRHFAAISPAARCWLSTRMQSWPDRYRRIYWANPTPERP